jgi:hypothetical protein
MKGPQELAEDMDGEERILLARYERAKRNGQELWMRRRGIREMCRALDKARPENASHPMYVVQATTSLHDQADREYRLALEAEGAAMAELSRYIDGRMASVATAAGEATGGMAQ